MSRATETPVSASSPAPPAGTPTGSCDRNSKPSNFANLLLREVLWGSLPVKRAAKYARAIVADGSTHPDVVKLSKVGAKGFAASNSWRDLKRQLRKPNIGSAVGKCMPPAKEFAPGIKEASIPILYPHEFLAVLYRDHRPHFDKHILNGSANTIPTFWDEMMDHPCYPNHPMHAHALADFRTHATPIRLYGDGTPVTRIGKAWKKEADTILFSSCLVSHGFTISL